MSLFIAALGKRTLRYVSFSFAIAAFGGVSLSSLSQSDPFQSSAHAADAQVVNVYSYRQPVLINPLLAEFTKQTGIKTNVIFAKKGLIERIAAEGKLSPADVLLTVDIGRLSAAVEKGISQPLKSSVIEGNIPGKYRSENGDWFGLTVRSRVVYASKARVAQDSITYEELADPKWRGNQRLKWLRLKSVYDLEIKNGSILGAIFVFTIQYRKSASLAYGQRRPCCAGCVISISPFSER